MKIFISHKLQDSATANLIAKELKEIKVDYYLDVLDNSITENGKELTNHIRANLNKCTDIIVVMSNITKGYADGNFFEGRCFFAGLFTVLASIKEKYGY